MRRGLKNADHHAFLTLCCPACQTFVQCYDGFDLRRPQLVNVLLYILPLSFGSWWNYVLPLVYYLPPQEISIAP